MKPSDRAVHHGYVYMIKLAVGPKALRIVSNADKATKAIKATKALDAVTKITPGASWANVGVQAGKGIFDIGKGLVDMGFKAVPYMLAAPPLLGAAVGYGASQVTAPSGEDQAEAQKHLEEQALLQFQADVDRQRKARQLAKKLLLERKGDKKEREIRL